jgi:hypothetical protein
MALKDGGIQVKDLSANPIGTPIIADWKLVSSNEVTFRWLGTQSVAILHYDIAYHEYRSPHFPPITDEFHTMSKTDGTGHCQIFFGCRLKYSIGLMFGWLNIY